MQGRDLIAAAETGSGKTLAYSLPLLSQLLFDPPAYGAPLAALVLCPTRELAMQVADHMRQVLVVNKESSGEGRRALQVATVVGGMPPLRDGADPHGDGAEEPDGDDSDRAHLQGYPPRPSLAGGRATLPSPAAQTADGGPAASSGPLGRAERPGCGLG